MGRAGWRSFTDRLRAFGVSLRKSGRPAPSDVSILKKIAEESMFFAIPMKTRRHFLRSTGDGDIVA